MKVDRRRLLAENIGSLAILQAANYLIPLVVLPYLVRVLGAGNYGHVVFAQAFAGYFIVITDYGFNLTATRRISLNRDRPGEVSRIFSGVMMVKISLLLLSAAIAAMIVLAAPRFRSEWPVHAAAFGMVVGSVLFPTWFFQGMERMKFITIVNVAAKALAAVSIFIFVQQRSDYVLAAFIQSAGFLLAGVAGLAVAGALFDLTFRVPDLGSVREMMVDGWHVFVSQASVTLFSNSNVFILGLFASSAAVGYYAVAEKIVRAVIGLSIPVTNAIYPTVSALFDESRERAVRFLRRVAWLGAAAFLVVGAALFLSADLLVFLVAGEADPTTALLIRIMSLLPLTVFLDNLYGTQILLNIGREKTFMHAVLAGGVFSVTAALILVPRLYALGSAITFAVTGVVVLLLMALPVRREGIGLLRDPA